MFDLSKYKQNDKTKYLAENLERLLKEESEVLVLAKNPDMKEMAETDLQNIASQKQILLEQMDKIIEEDERKQKRRRNFKRNSLRSASWSGWGRRLFLLKN